ncbi:MAG: lysophospholipid acyltransferase family protein [Amphritea sp.]
MHPTIFATAIIKPLLRWVSRSVLRLRGWKVDYSGIEGVDKCVVIGAPHTSNWDLPYALMLAFGADIPIYWMGKIQIFRFPFRHLMMWLGGIPVDRARSHNVVDAAIEQFNNQDQLFLVIAPEGTRSSVTQWKSGFYHIAHGAQVPILLAFLDYSTKTAGIVRQYHTSGDIDKDLPEIQGFYQTILDRNQ